MLMSLIGPSSTPHYIRLALLIIIVILFEVPTTAMTVTAITSFPEFFDTVRIGTQVILHPLFDSYPS